jgi:hypothetical protein
MARNLAVRTIVTLHVEPGEIDLLIDAMRERWGPDHPLTLYLQRKRGTLKT